MSYAIVGSRTADGEVLISETERERNVLNAYGKTMDTVSANPVWALLIDLSNTGGQWPHGTGSSRLDLSTFSINIDKTSNATGSVSLGVVTRVGATDGDVTLIFGNTPQHPGQVLCTKRMQ